MKLEMTVNLGNYQNIKITTNEYIKELEAYKELFLLVFDWVDYHPNAVHLAKHLKWLIQKNYGIEVGKGWEVE